MIFQQGHMENYPVISGVMVVTVSRPAAGASVDFDATLPATLAGGNYGIPKIPTPMVIQTARINDFKKLPGAVFELPAILYPLLPEAHYLAFGDILHKFYFTR
jgi:hypothetical protein